MQETVEPRGFVTTRWSLVLAGARFESGEAEARAALAELCRTYWRPVYSFVCRRGYSTEDAQDLTQDFFAMILETTWLQRADQNRGRFRSFLLKSVAHLLSHAVEKGHTKKRGGDRTFVPWDEWMAAAPAELPGAAQSLVPELFFDVCWATTVLEKALARLREECETSGRLRLFETLRHHLITERGETSYADLARVLGVAETTVKKQLHNMRERHRWLLRDEVAQTVENAADVEDEIRHLCHALAAVS